MVYGRMYTAEVGAVAVTAVQDFFEINAPADAIVVLDSAFIGQASDEGDAEAEMLQVELATTDNTLAGSGGSTPTAQAHQTGDSAFGGTVEANNTTRSTVQTQKFSETFNVQAGWYYEPTEKAKQVLSPSATFIVGLLDSIADSLTMSGRVTIEEIGG